MELFRLQPEADRTQGGWTNMVLWLENNPPRSRVSTYFNGLFSGESSAKRCDAILLHLDSDLVSKKSFREFMLSKHGLQVNDSTEPKSRGEQIVMAIKTIGDFSQLAASDSQRHVLAPAVESTETWCIGVFRHQPGVDIEALTGDELRDTFMEVLHRSEGRRGSGPYDYVNKSVRRRKKFCIKHASGFGKLEAQSFHYRRLIDDLIILSRS